LGFVLQRIRTAFKRRAFEASVPFLAGAL
jgi:hypothetical protein